MPYFPNERIRGKTLRVFFSPSVFVLRVFFFSVPLRLCTVFFFCFEFVCMSSLHAICQLGQKMIWPGAGPE